MDILAIVKIMFAVVILEFVAVPVCVYIRRQKNPDQTGLPSPGTYAASIGIAAVVGYITGVLAGIKIACSMEEAGNLCGLTGYFFYGPFFALVAAILAPLVVWIIGKAVSKSDHQDNPAN